MKKLNTAFRKKSFKILDIYCIKNQNGYRLVNSPNTISVANIKKYYVSLADVTDFGLRDGSVLCAPHFREQLRFEFINRLRKPDTHLKENNNYTVYYY